MPYPNSMPKEILRCLFYIKADSDEAISCLFRSFTSDRQQSHYYSVFQIESELDGSFECEISSQPNLNGEFEIFELTNSHDKRIVGKIVPAQGTGSPKCTIYDESDSRCSNDETLTSPDPFIQSVMNNRHTDDQDFSLVVLKDELEILS